MSNPLVLPEIVGFVIDNVHLVPDLLSCACVNSIWSAAALKKLYKGSLNDMQFCTPDIGSLNCLFVASRKRFARYMGFVKHLLLSPKTPAIDDATHPNTRLACFEKCRAMRHRQYAELLLRPRGRGFASLTIPFEIIDQDWSLISDLLLTPTIEFLAIDNFYCEILEASSSYSQEIISPAEKFSNLKALTIYKSEATKTLTTFAEYLKVMICTQSNTAELLPYLQQQQHLKALALVVPRCDAPSGYVSATLAREKHKGPWPRLKALYLQEWDELWLEQLPKFEELEILRMRLPPRIPNISLNTIEEIAKCRQLRVIDLVFDELAGVEALLNIARGCPLLQKFRVMGLGFNVESEQAGNMLSDLLRALPLLEFLALGLNFQMDGTKLQDLARHCPRLTVLDLPRTQLSVSLALMTKTHSLPQLESMHFAGIYFENSRLMMQRDKIRKIVMEWHRIFPKLRGMPCPADVYSHCYIQGDLDTESQEDRGRASAGEEMSFSQAGLDFDDYDSDWIILRAKLWRALGYKRDPFIHDKIQYMWQTDLEIEIIGWPVVPLVAFSDPDPHSTTTN
ncbi:hypothetical protein ETB97_010487 [Aspergillus alliaceus]|uniref:F-box domain-containing protein n=1 Tax=Petromyces alliaceus TaxID=209559 RepID=A0A8H6E175_PETAA|nr:hypothetical protein ETB97_010487 [Aspergillus burnettii]